MVAALPARPDLRVRQARQEPLALAARRVILVIQVQQDIQAQRVIQEPLVLLALLARLVRQVIPVIPAIPVLLARLALPVRPELRQM